MSKKNLTILLLAVAAIILAAVLVHRPHAAPVAGSVVPKADNGTPILSGDVRNFVTLSIMPGETIPVSAAETVTGSVKGGYFFEGTARGMILDGNKKVIKTFPITATSDWTTEDIVSFTFTLDPSGVPAGAGFVRIANDNASGDPGNDKYIDVPVVFK